MFLSKQLSDLFRVAAINKFETMYTQIYNKDNFGDFLKKFVDSLNSSLAVYETIDSKIITYKSSYIRTLKQDCFEKSLKSWFLSLDNTSTNKKNSKKKDKATIVYELIMNTDTIDLTNTAPQELLANRVIHKQFSSVNSLDSFEKLYGTKDFNEYVKKIIGEIYDWVKDNDKLLCNYKYLNVISPTKMKNWFKKDLELFFYKFIYANCDINQPSLKLDISPMEYNLNIPIDPSNRRTTTLREGNTFFHIHEVNEHIRVKTIIIIPDADKNTEKQKLFNLFDFKVIKALIELSDEDFFTTRKVVCDFGDIVKKLSSSRSDKIYKEVHDSIRKISSYQSVYENDLTRESRNYDIYTADIICKDRNDNDIDHNEVIDPNDFSMKSYNRLVVKANFSEKYIQQLLESAIFIDKEIMLTSNMAQALIAPLQCERYKKLNDDNLTSKLGYNSYFNAVLTLGRTNKSNYIKQIEKALAEIEASNTIIKSFHRSKDYFFIEFYPLLKNEKGNLLNCIEFFANRGLPINLPFNLTDALGSMDI